VPYLNDPCTQTACGRIIDTAGLTPDPPGRRSEAATTKRELGSNKEAEQIG